VVKNQRAILFVLGVALTAISMASTALAEPLIIYGGPTFDQSTQSGYRDPALPLGSSVGNGVAVGYAWKYTGSTTNSAGQRAFRWDSSGSAATELGILGTDSQGRTDSFAMAMNSAGVTVGYMWKYSGSTPLGQSAVRWDPSGSAATELANLGADSQGHGYSTATAINRDGVVVGYSIKFNGDAALGNRAVRWTASGMATELGNLGSNQGYADNRAYAVNAAGITVGFAEKYSPGFVFLGNRPVRWNANNLPNELGILGTDSSGFTDGRAFAINTAGTAVGYTNKYTGGTNVGNRAVRWDMPGNIATELGNLGVNSLGFTSTYAYAINDAGTAVGYATKYRLGGAHLGERAVRWDASGSAATELGNLGTDSSGFTSSTAYAINRAGAAVGYASKYTGGGTLVGQRAVLWNLDSLAIDLNTLIDPASGWTLTRAYGISDSNWVSGTGSFDPDGAGPLLAYDRAFLLSVSSLVPEPTGLSLLAAGGLTLLRRRRQGVAAAVTAR
jgi:hypothetical protein